MVFVAANAVWVAAVAADGMAAIYLVADVLCVGAAALLLGGVTRASPALVGAGAAGSLLCQAPFYAFVSGWVGFVGQAAYVATCLAFAAAAWLWHRRSPRTRSALRASGWLLLLTSVGWILDWNTLWNLFQLGNALSGAAGVLLMTADDPLDAARP